LAAGICDDAMLRGVFWAPSQKMPFKCKLTFKPKSQLAKISYIERSHNYIYMRHLNT